jgi:hypothetical protein
MSERERETRLVGMSVYVLHAHSLKVKAVCVCVCVCVTMPTLPSRGGCLQSYAGTCACVYVCEAMCRGGTRTAGSKVALVQRDRKRVHVLCPPRAHARQEE